MTGNVRQQRAGRQGSLAFALCPGKHYFGSAPAPETLQDLRFGRQAVGARSRNAGTALQLGGQQGIRPGGGRPGGLIEAHDPERIDRTGQRIGQAANFDPCRSASGSGEGLIATLPLHLAQGLAGIDATKNGIQRDQVAQNRA